MANYHPNDELLMQFSAGQTTNALGVMVACHLEKCVQCRTKVQMYNQLGGEILESTEPSSVSSDLKDKILSKLDASLETEPPQPVNPADGRLPKPLWRFIPAHLDELDWKGFSSSIKEYTLPISDQTYTAKFYRIAAGKELPEHTHKGNEFTYVLDGSFSDKSGSYHEGDFILADTQIIHQPQAAMDKDCICFAVMDAPLKMTGFFGRMLNPFLR